MRILSRLVAGAILAATSPTLAAELLPQPALVHVEVSDGKHITDHAVTLAPDGEGALEVDAGPEVTKVRLRVIKRPSGAVLDFDVSHTGPAHAGYSARGEIAPPHPGKRVLIARVPQPGGSIDVLLTIAPSSDGDAAAPAGPRP